MRAVLAPARRLWLRLPARLRRVLRSLGVTLVALTLVKAVWLGWLRTDARRLLEGGEREDLEARRAYLVARLLGSDRPGDGALAPADPTFAGEWQLVALSMTAAAVTSLAFDEPRERGEALAVTAGLIDAALSPACRAFDARKWGEDPIEVLAAPGGHVGYLGHLHLMLAAWRLLGGEEPARIELAARIQDALIRRMRGSPSSYLETYPGETYTADNAVSVAALALHDDASGAARDPVIERWLEHTRRELLDPRTGLIVSGVDPRGAPIGAGRGSWAGWCSFYLPFIDEALAADQYGKLRRHLAEPLLFGAAGVREHARGVDGGGDVDSGPVVWGISPSGTGFAIAGARRARDVELLDGLLTTAELFGSTVQWAGRRRYLLAPLVGDAILLAMKTAPPWDRRFLEPMQPR